MNREETRLLLKRIVRVLWLLVIAADIFIGLRVLLKLLAANPSAPFAQMTYGLTDVMIAPFAGLTDVMIAPFAGLTVTPSAAGVVLDVPAIVAMLVYVLFGWLAAQLIWAVFAPAKKAPKPTAADSEFYP
jgi:hypothetical protein